MTHFWIDSSENYTWQRKMCFILENSGKYFKFQGKKKDFFVSSFLYFLQMYLLYADDGRFLSCFFLKRNAHTNFTSGDWPAQMTSTQFVHWRLMTVLLWKFGTSFLKCVNHIIGFDPLHSTRVEWNLTTWFQTTCYTRNWGWEGI